MTNSGARTPKTGCDEDHPRAHPPEARSLLSVKADIDNSPPVKAKRDDLQEFLMISLKLCSDSRCSKVGVCSVT